MLGAPLCRSNHKHPHIERERGKEGERESKSTALSLDHFVRSKALSMRTYDPEFSSSAFCFACSHDASAAKHREREKENREETPHFHV